MKSKQPSITCSQCGRTSYHPQDIARAFCGYCKLWHNKREVNQMTIVPTIYVDKYDSRYWMFFTSPSGAVVRLYTSYPAQGDAEMAAAILGFKLVPKPADRPTVMLGRGNTTAR